ncbi:MAG: DnaJ domain-containing protein [Cyclobacteriaceae bacterium]
MSNTYLETLGLRPGATKSQIKSAYRKLSKRYHPDVNKSPEAHEQFIAINEAYRFLTEVGPTPHQETVSYDYNPYQREYEDRRRRARAYAQRQAHEAQRRQEASIKYALGIFNSMAYAILAFNLMLCVDYLMPASINEMSVTEIKPVMEGQRAGSARYRYNDYEFDDGVKVRVNKGKNQVKVDQICNVVITPIFSVPKYFDAEVQATTIRYHQSYSIYSVFGYVIPAIFLIAIFYRFILKTLDQKFTLAIVMTAAFCFQLFMFFRF